ncbi:hypothetical protein AKJ43_00665 [candidate division MSBL1 archaeon SCGC-AAA261D19]|uniref:Radical SAM core domain-containing protein n=1 Tax=candidate division MSBL1 archaeon SCGC-AAA261D19 TaxID=1698273 RepID=A0A133V8J2_9EURY|nr:hypothetical protein AKJ43_00665 [candidate division MSBL1 archaeon SCGC-AAA261D19]
MRVNEVECKSIISDSGITSVDYSINPYRGCEHGCRYCYATFMKKYTNHTEPWGTFVDAKINVKEALDRDLSRKKGGSVLMSSVTDAYQPAEGEYELTRCILERLLDTNFFVNILTKSNLIIRDLDLLADFGPERVSVGFTVNFVEEDDKSVWEPSSPSVAERIDALKTLSEAGVPTYVHVGPYLEGITNLEAILKETEDFIFELQVENLNLRGKRRTIMEIIEENYPWLKSSYKRICNNDFRFSDRLQGRIQKLSRIHPTSIRFC